MLSHRRSFSSPQRVRRAFTLVELLVVVAIISILAALAAPNFLEAQTRSKISRVHADLASATVALEAYRVDYNAYPAYGNALDIDGGSYPGAYGIWYLPMRLTTPVAFITTLPNTPFPETESGRTVEPYRYFNRQQFFDRQPTIAPAAWGLMIKNYFGAPVAKEWDLFSYGPDRTDDGPLPYDPTNGTFSAGDIPRFGP